MANIDSNFDDAAAIAKRLGKRNKDVARAMSNRDICLYRLFERVHEIDRQLLEMTEEKAGKVLTAKYGNSIPKNASDFLKLICSELPPKRLSKYGKLLTFVRMKKGPGQSLRKFVRVNGGINGCVNNEKELRRNA